MPTRQNQHQPHLRSGLSLIASLVVLVVCAPVLAQSGEEGEPTTQGEEPEPVPTPAEPELTPEELAELEASLRADTEDASKEEAQDTAFEDTHHATATPRGDYLETSFILDVAAAWFGDEPLQVGAHDPNRTGFTLQQLEMSLSGNVDPFLSFDANIVLAQFGVEVEEAYATTTALPWNLQARGGQFLTRFGRINPTHPHSWDFADQPLVNGKFFGPEGSRGLGLELSWLSPLPWFAEATTSVSDAAGACCARSFFGADDLGVEGPGDLLVTSALKQFFPLGEAWSLLWGVSGQFGPNASGNGNRTEIYGTDLYLRYRPPHSTTRSALTLTVEAMMRQRQVPFSNLRDFGGYGALVWTINPSWAVGARHDLTTGVEDDPLDPDPDQDGDHNRTSLQVTYSPSHFSRLRLQGAYDNPSWRDGFATTFLTLEVLTGDHGAHGY